MADEKKPYRVKYPYRFGAHDEHGPGSVVHLRDDEAAPVIFKLEAVRGEIEAKAEAEAKKEEEGPTLTELVGPDVAAKLAAGGVETVEEIKELSDEDLESIPGIGPATVKAIRKAVS